MDNKDIKLTLSEYKVLNILQVIKLRGKDYDTTSYNISATLKISLSSVVKAYRKLKDLNLIRKMDRDCHYTVVDSDIVGKILKNNSRHTLEIAMFK